MPELPEVETVRRGLLPTFENHIIKDVIVRRRDLRTPIPDDFEDRIRNQKVTELTRRSKYILATLEDGATIIIHLGMSGRIRIETGNAGEPDKHDHVEWVTDHRHVVRFGDPRRFGFIDLIEPGDIENYPALKKLGPEPLEAPFDGAYLHNAFKNRKTSMKAALMDQRLIAGLGNIYVNEALYRSGIAPTRAAGSVSRPKLNLLAGIIKDVLREAIEAGGSSLNDHRQTNGELGYFQHSFRVYGREGESCSQCAEKGKESSIKRIIQQGRSTFYCSDCQR